MLKHWWESRRSYLIGPRSSVRSKSLSKIPLVWLRLTIHSSTGPCNSSAFRLLLFFRTTWRGVPNRAGCIRSGEPCAGFFCRRALGPEYRKCTRELTSAKGASAENASLQEQYRQLIGSFQAAHGVSSDSEANSNYQRLSPEASKAQEAPAPPHQRLE